MSESKMRSKVKNPFNFNDRFPAAQRATFNTVGIARPLPDDDANALQLGESAMSDDFLPRWVPDKYRDPITAALASLPSSATRLDEGKALIGAGLAVALGRMTSRISGYQPEPWRVPGGLNRNSFDLATRNVGVFVEMAAGERDWVPVFSVERPIGVTRRLWFDRETRKVVEFIRYENGRDHLPA